MTRKRFIKLMMSVGVSRNAANEFTVLVTNGNYLAQSYFDVWNYVYTQYAKDGE